MITNDNKRQITSTDIKHMLFTKYAAPAYAFFSEVADSPGRCSRYADGISYSLYPSTGFEIQGFEIKISHSDFMNEIKDPSKSDEIMRFCDRWWIVAPKGIIKKEELPATWGLMEVRGDNRLYVVKQAPLLKKSSVEPDRAFIASMFRRATEDKVPRSLFYKAYQMGYISGKKDEKANWENEHCSIREKLERVRRFEEASGLCATSSWGGGKALGEAVKFVMSYDYERIGRGVESAIENIKDTLSKLENLKSLSDLAKLLKK